MDAVTSRPDSYELSTTDRPGSFTGVEGSSVVTMIGKLFGLTAAAARIDERSRTRGQ